MTEIFAPFDGIIYVGSGHSKSVGCSNFDVPKYDNVTMRFETRHTEPLFLTVNVCTACGSIFLPYRKYDKHCFHLACYDFIRVKDGKMPFEERILHLPEECVQFPWHTGGYIPNAAQSYHTDVPGSIPGHAGVAPLRCGQQSSSVATGHR